MRINKNKLHFTREFFFCTERSIYNIRRNLWFNWQMKCDFDKCTLYITMQNMISSHDIEARQLSIDKQRQWCNIYTLLRTVILFSCLPSFHLYLTTGKWKILPLIEKYCAMVFGLKNHEGGIINFSIYIRLSLKDIA